MTIILDDYAVPEIGSVQLSLNFTFDIKVSAEQARRKVNRWLLNEVSYLIWAETPTLAVGKRAVWRVPAVLGYPSFGKVGTVGMVEVDVETGELNNAEERKTEIEQQGLEIASRFPLEKVPSREVPVPSS